MYTHIHLYILTPTLSITNHRTCQALAVCAKCENEVESLSGPLEQLRANVSVAFNKVSVHGAPYITTTTTMNPIITPP